MKIAVRPEAIGLEASEEEAGLTGTVTQSTYVGNHVEYTLETGLGEIFVADYQYDALIPAGTRVRIAFRDRGVTLLESQT